MKKAGIVVAAAGAAALMLPTAASAAPKPDPNSTLALDCPGTALDGPVTVPPGDADWTPAFKGHTTFVPVAFGTITGTFTAPDGTVETFTEPPTAQNTNKGGNHPRVTCTFSGGGSEDGGTFSFTGTVTAIVVGKP
jgi:hypothetical protein